MESGEHETFWLRKVESSKGSEHGNQTRCKKGANHIFKKRKEVAESREEQREKETVIVEVCEV